MLIELERLIENELRKKLKRSLGLNREIILPVQREMNIIVSRKPQTMRTPSELSYINKILCQTKSE